MRYDDPELRDRLAAEYVLGTLAGAARQRFERLMRQDPELRAHVEAWQGRLGPLSEAVQPVQPPSRVWRRISRQIGATEGEIGRHPSNQVRLWQGIAAAAGIAALALGLYAGWMPSPDPTAPAMVAVVQDAENHPAWLLRADPKAGTVQVTALGERRAPAGKDYELWLIPDGDDATPRSCGLLPSTGTARMRLSAEEQRMLPSVHMVGVTLEPDGGSPSGRPTGPILFQAKIHPTG